MNVPTGISILGFLFSAQGPVQFIVGGWFFYTSLSTNVYLQIGIPYIALLAIELSVMASGVLTFWVGRRLRSLRPWTWRISILLLLLLLAFNMGFELDAIAIINFVISIGFLFYLSLPTVRQAFEID